MPLKFAAILGAVLAVALGGSASAAIQKFVAMAGGERVGHLTADVQGRTVAVDYAINNNGRGPKARERIELDAAGMPVRWTIEGESLFGSPVNERMPEVWLSSWRTVARALGWGKSG